MADIFNELKNQKNYSREKSTTWFRRNINRLANKEQLDPNVALQNKTRLTTQLELGKMFLFKYDPKLKATLPMYDKFPLIIPFNRDSTSFTGLNFHYLPYNSRVRLLDRLMFFASDTKYDKTTKLKITWNLLSNYAKFPEVRPCVKKYLYTHVQTRFLSLDASEWKTAILLPYEQFVYKT